MTTSASLPNLPRIPIDWRWPIALVLSTALVVVVITYFYFPDLPDPMPVHWNAAGEADGFQAKTLPNFLFTLLIAPVILLVVLLGSQALISHLSTTITGVGSGVKDTNQAHRVWLGQKHMMSAMGWYLTGLNLVILIGFAATYGPGSGSGRFLVLILIGAGVLTAFLIWSSVRAQREAERRYPPPEEERGKRWGIFHNDPEDSRIFVPTEGGGGSNFTPNIGTTGGRIAAAVLFGLPVILLLWVTWQAF